MTWFEEQLSSNDVDGLAAVRDDVRCDVAAGEYAYDQFDVDRLLPVVDCLQLDATRCGGYTGWPRGASSAQAQPPGVGALRPGAAGDGQPGRRGVPGQVRRRG